MPGGDAPFAQVLGAVTAAGSAMDRCNEEPQPQCRGMSYDQYLYGLKYPAVLIAAACVDAIRVLGRVRVSAHCTETHHDLAWTLWDGPLLTWLVWLQTGGVLPSYDVEAIPCRDEVAVSGILATWIVDRRDVLALGERASTELWQYSICPNHIGHIRSHLHADKMVAPGFAIVLDMIDQCEAGRVPYNRVPGNVFIGEYNTLLTFPRVFDVLTQEGTCDNAARLLNELVMIGATKGLVQVQIIAPERRPIRLTGFFIENEFIRHLTRLKRQEEPALWKRGHEQRFAGVVKVVEGNAGVC
jgi:hypothetical protein